ncbi:MAG: protein phosphatase 2C domain-containing protein [Oscillospiraceae bacterium]|nr:protein phosphatase 2C domain-containing protein [Oscillospiraceae bacterium]
MTVINFECTAITHVGSVRGNNEDNYYVNGKFKKDNNVPTEGYTDTTIRDSYVYAVCDGMGGEYFGEIASMIAVAVLAEYQDTDLRYSIMDYVERTNNIICGEIEKHDGIRSGTTLALLFIYGNKAVSYNIGDSRVYLLRKNELYLLSEDHTEAQRMVDMGVINDEEAKNHKLKNRLTQHLGIFPNELVIDPYASQEIKIKKNDIFLICSDGLTDMVDDDEIRLILSTKNTDTVGIAKRLSAAADAYGGKDNTTVVVIKAT